MRRGIWLPLTLLVLVSLGCSLLGRAEEAIELGKEAATRVSEVASTIDEEAVATLVPDLSGEGAQDEESGGEEASEDEGEGAESDVEPPQIDVEALDRLESYRTRFTSEWRPEQGDPEVIRFEEARTRDPGAYRMVMEGFAEGEAIEMVQIGDQSWMCGGGSCTEIEADPEELAEGFGDEAMLNPSDIVDQGDGTFLGRERVNGIQTRHYQLDIDPGEAAFLSQGEISNVRGESWVADEPDLPAIVVRFEMSWTETRDGEKGQVSFIHETYDINAPFTIEPPEGAEKSGLPDDVPLYPGGSQMLSMEGMTSLEAPDGVDQVAEFYRESLPAQGWTLGSDDAMGSMVQQVWSKEGRTLTLMITEEDGGSNIIVSMDDEG